MHWELLELILVVIAVFSQFAMINYAIARDKDQSMLSFLLLYNVFRIPEYISITRKEKGRIGWWFWTFIVSIILLVCVVVIEICTTK